jgi:serine/threonine protein kinase/formylglycine-generating enzyme required for sulfatase activity
VAETSESGLTRAIEGFLDQEAGAGRLEGIEGLPRVGGAGELGPGALLGEFELIRRLGGGGMGVVFVARQRSLGGRDVAVKVLRGVLRSPRNVVRFRREIEAIARLDHPSIVPVISSGLERDTPYFAMKIVEGMALHEVIRVALERHGAPPAGTAEIRAAILRRVADEHGDEPGSTDSSSTGEDRWNLPYVRWVARVGLDLASALQHAHEHGVVHRDVKPANVMVTPGGRAVLLDFGLALHESDEALTETGQFLGTLGYVSPEQAHGEEVDARSDLWSLGAILYELLTFRRPFEGASRGELLARIDRDDPPRLPSAVPRELRILVERALQRDPARRVASAGQLAADLAAFLAGRPIRTRPRSRVHRVRLALRRHPWVTSVAAVVLLLLGTLRARDAVLASGAVTAGVELTRAYGLARTTWEVQRARLIELLSDERPRPSARSLEISAARRATEAARRAAWERFDHAESALRQAFVHVRGHASARDSLATLYAQGVAQALGEHDDLRGGEHLASLEARLVAVDHGDAHTRWVDPAGSVTLSTRPATARVRIRPALVEEGFESPIVHEGTTPLTDLRLPEGSYTASLEAPGRAPVTLPFVVRRAACYDDPRARPPRALTVDLPAEGEVPEGFVHVPAGWTPVADDPVRWAFVEDFQVQVDEVSQGQLVEWMNALGVAPAEESLVPHSPFDPDQRLVAWSAEGWRVPEEGAVLPARGLTPSAMQRYAIRLHEVLAPGCEDGWFTRLPTRAQWIRAARGADCRRYPWGDEFSWILCAGYPSTGPGIHEPNPVPVTAFPDDRSPLGVHALAGSMRELTASYHEGTVDQKAVCGGSYRSIAPDEMAITRVGGTLNVAQWDLGFRVVRQRIPVALRPLEGPPRPFVDVFADRADGDLGPWFASAGEPLFETLVLDEEQDAKVTGGRLVVRTREGNHASRAVRVTRGLQVGERSFAITLAARASFSQVLPGRGLGLGLQAALTTGAPRLQVTLDTGGRLLFSEPPGTPPVPGVPPEAPFVLELTRRGARHEVRVWRPDDLRPAAPQLVRELARPFEPRYLYLRADSLVGALLEVDHVRLDWLD